MGLYDRDYMRANYREPNRRYANQSSSRRRSHTGGRRGFSVTGILTFLVVIGGGVGICYLLYDNLFGGVSEPTSVEGKWVLDLDNSINQRRAFLDKLYSVGMGNEAGNPFLAALLGGLTEANLQNLRSHWEMDMEFKSDNTFKMVESTYLMSDVEFNGRWELVESSEANEVRVYFDQYNYAIGRINGRSMKIVFADNNGLEFPVCVLRKKYLGMF